MHQNTSQPMPQRPLSQTITTAENIFVSSENNYLKKIKYLKQSLAEKTKRQLCLTEQLKQLHRQYEQHHQEIASALHKLHLETAIFSATQSPTNSNSVQNSTRHRKIPSLLSPEFKKNAGNLIKCSSNRTIASNNMGKQIQRRNKMKWEKASKQNLNITVKKSLQPIAQRPQKSPKLEKKKLNLNLFKEPTYCF